MKKTAETKTIHRIPEMFLENVRGGKNDKDKPKVKSPPPCPPLCEDPI